MRRSSRGQRRECRSRNRRRRRTDGRIPAEGGPEDDRSIRSAMSRLASMLPRRGHGRTGFAAIQAGLAEGRPVARGNLGDLRGAQEFFLAPPEIDVGEQERARLAPDPPPAPDPLPAPSPPHQAPGPSPPP